MSEFHLLRQADGDATADTHKRLEKMFFNINVLLGGSSIEVHLEDDDFHVAFDMAVQTYRYMRSRSVYETYGFSTFTKGQSRYVLNDRIDNVISVMRGRGGLFGGGLGSSGFESFGAATINTMMRGGVSPGTGQISLATYDFTMQYMELMDRLFARDMHFHYDNGSHTLSLGQTPNTNETIGLRVMVLKRIDELLNDHWSARWLQTYTQAQCRIILGEKYSLFATVPGAQGGITLKGEQLKTQGQADIEKLEESLLLYADSSMIPLPIRT